MSGSTYRRMVQKRNHILLKASKILSISENIGFSRCVGSYKIGNPYTALVFLPYVTGALSPTYVDSLGRY